MEAKQATDPLPLVVVVRGRGERAVDVDRFLEAGVPVLIAPSAEVARTWLADHRGGEGPVEVPGHEVVRADRLQIDLTSHRVTWGGVPLDVTNTEMHLLATLARDVGRVFSFSELLTSVWGTPRYGDAECVRSAVKRLRKRLVLAGVPILVEAVRGLGFRLAATH